MLQLVFISASQSEQGSYGWMEMFKVSTFYPHSEGPVGVFQCLVILPRICIFYSSRCMQKKTSEKYYLHRIIPCLRFQWPSSQTTKSCNSCFPGLSLPGTNPLCIAQESKLDKCGILHD
ncbi:hypothetical protein SAY87_024703 [Trapa incisa]|uniref:Uncharacterized protein n=1 Tax=Trapa incisa TaxID=236973 RepID=A0AAN7JFZ2_9MYRT|nr:hypothetical protein SAY87_024703 [Trapa incisa]